MPFKILINVKFRKIFLEIAKLIFYKVLSRNIKILFFLTSVELVITNSNIIIN